MNVIKRFQQGCALLLVVAGATAYAADKSPAPAAVKAAGHKAVQQKTAETEPTILFKVPLFSRQFDDFPAATVDNDPITLKELVEALAGAHEERPETKGAGKKRYRDMLDRLVKVSLMVHEARNMGLDELPETKASIDRFSQDTLGGIVANRAIQDVKPDTTETEKLYQELVKEYKITSVLFEKEDAAKKAWEELKGSKNFEEAVKKLLDSMAAKESYTESYKSRDKLLPEIAQTVTSMKVGSISPVTNIEAGWVIMKVDDVRIPEKENTAARDQARELSLKSQKSRALMAYKNGLIKKYVTMNARVFNKLDFEAPKPGFDKLLLDDRVIAEIKGEKPITVADLAKAIKAKLFHGVQSAIESKTVNEKKMTAFDEMTSRRIFLKEALSRGLDKTDEYKDTMKNYENSLLFDLFMKRAVVPDVKPKPEDMKAYYESHKKEYSTPRMVMLDSIAFTDRKRAVAALSRLRKGTDFKWLKENAKGAATGAADLTALNIPVTVVSLPDALQKAIDGAAAGDTRLYAGPDDVYYLVLVSDVVPEKTQPFEECSSMVKKAVIQNQLDKALDAWIEKLRAAYAVKIYLTDTE